MALNDDDSAADTLPVALAGTVILVAVIVAMAVFGIKNATPPAEQASVDRQVEDIANDCRFLLSLAPRQLDDPGSPPGAMRHVVLDLPAGTEYLSFGHDPDSGDGHGGTIYYKVHGAKKAIVVDAQATFRSIRDSHVILRSGRYDIRIEYGRDALGQRYLLLEPP